jgi:hypothetical protein
MIQIVYFVFSSVTIIVSKYQEKTMTGPLRG